MIINEQNKILKTNIDNFDTYSIEINSIAVKTTIDMYSDKSLAVIRELLTNAWDSHIIANNTDTPIDVDLFYTDDNTFRIRDYGTGISKEGMKDYCTIYKSSKRNTNTQTGCFGIGSKVPFCIVDNYIVHSYYNGIKLSYLMSLSDVLPKFVLLSEVETDEPNGLEIEIQVENETMQNNLLNKLCILKAFVNIKINIIGYDENKLPKAPAIIYQKDNIAIYDKAYYYDDYYKKTIIDYFNINYGNNIYKYYIDSTAKDLIGKYIKSLNLFNNIEQILNDLFVWYNSGNNLIDVIIIDIPLSAGLTITPSREALEETENNRDIIIQAILKAIDTIANDGIKHSILYKDKNLSCTLTTNTLIEQLNDVIGAISNSYNYIAVNIEEHFIPESYCSAYIHNLPEFYKCNGIYNSRSYKKYMTWLNHCYTVDFNFKYSITNTFNSFLNQYIYRNNTPKNLNLLVVKNKLDIDNINVAYKVYKSLLNNNKYYDDTFKPDLLSVVNNEKDFYTLKVLIKILKNKIDVNVKVISIDTYNKQFQQNKLRNRINRQTVNSSYNRYKINIYRFTMNSNRNYFSMTSLTVKQFQDKYLTEDNTKKFIITSRINKDLVLTLSAFVKYKEYIPKAIYEDIKNHVYNKLNYNMEQDIVNTYYMYAVSDNVMDNDVTAFLIQNYTNVFTLDNNTVEEVIDKIQNIFIYKTKVSTEHLVTQSYYSNNNIFEITTSNIDSFIASPSNNVVKDIKKLINNRLLLWMYNLYNKKTPTTKTGKLIQNYINRRIRRLQFFILYRYLFYNISHIYRHNKFLTHKYSDTKIRNIFKYANILNNNYRNQDNIIKENMSLKTFKEKIYKISYHTVYNKNNIKDKNNE